MYGRYMKGYRKTKLEAELSVATPHRVLQMMYEGLLERLAQAKGAIEIQDLAAKSERLSKAVGIINGLQMSIDKSADPEMGQRLSEMYDYMKQRLNDASLSLDTAAIDEVIELIIPIKEAWDNIPPEVRDKMNAAIEEKNGLK